MTVRHEERVQSFPPGYFDFRDVQWAQGTTRKSSVKFLRAYISSDRVTDFISGESVRGSSSFWVSKTRNCASKGQAVRGTAPTTCYIAANANKTSHQYPRACPPQAHPTPAQCAIKETSYRCCYGPKDYSQNLPSAAPLEKGKRRSKIQHGESCKRGCLCHFMVRTAGGSDSIAELRMYCSDHHNAAGAACHGPLSQTTTRVTGAKRQPAKAANVKRNQQEKVVIQTVQRAADIPDDHVTLPAADGAGAEVRSPTDAAVRFTVSHPGTGAATCNCPLAERGSVCEHVVKVQLTDHLTTR